MLDKLFNVGLGMMGGNYAGQNQHRRQKRLMDLQFRNQQQLNQQGHDLQMDMWNKTNYGAQVDHMRKAGLNPALMYGMSGGGGTTTGSQGGGSASGGNAQAYQIMDLANAKLSAEIEKLKTETRNLEKDLDVKEVTIQDMSQGIENKKAQEELTKLTSQFQTVMNEIQDKTKEVTIETTTKELENLLASTDGIKLENKLQSETMTANIERAYKEVVQIELENILKKADKKKTDTEIENMVKQIEINFAEKDIKKLEATVKQWYPNLMGVIGGEIKNVMDQIWNFANWKSARERNYKNLNDGEYKY